jgi:hypothetical protein
MAPHNAERRHSRRRRRIRAEGAVDSIEQVTDFCAAEEKGIVVYFFDVFLVYEVRAVFQIVARHARFFLHCGIPFLPWILDVLAAGAVAVLAADVHEIGRFVN